MIAVILSLAALTLTVWYLAWFSLVVQRRASVGAGISLAVVLFFDLFAFVISQYTGLSVSLLPILVLVPATFLTLALIHRPPTALIASDKLPLVVWLALLGYLALTLYWSANPAYGSWKLSVLLVRGVLPGLVIYLIYRRSAKLSWTPTLVLGTLYAVALIFLGAETSAYPGRYALAGSNPIWDARLVLLLAAVVLWHPKLTWPIKSLLLGTALTAAFLTQSRGPLVAFIAASLIVGLMQSFRRGAGTVSVRKLAGVVLVVPCLALLLLWEFNNTSDLSYSTFSSNSRFGVLTSRERLVADPNFLDRLELQSRALELFLDTPLIGVGLGGYALLAERSYPHNLPLELLSEAGLIGFLLWAAAFYLTLARAATLDKVLFALILQTLFYSLLSGDLAFNSELFLLCLVAVASHAPKVPARAVSTMPIPKLEA